MNSHDAGHEKKPDTVNPNGKRNERIAFFIIWFIIAAVIAGPAMLAGASPTVAVISGLVAGFIFSGIGKLLSRFNLPSL